MFNCCQELVPDGMVKAYNGNQKSRDTSFILFDFHKEREK